jgi:hypothetical protein
MAEKKKQKIEEKSDASKDALISVAETIGHAVGTLARKAGVGAEAKVSTKKGKLPPKNKKRLPRREKKAAQKKTASRV